MNENQQVDDEGVPCLIQGITYNYSCFWITATYFDGRTLRFEPPDCIGLTDHVLSPMQLLECKRKAELTWKEHATRGFESKATPYLVH